MIRLDSDESDDDCGDDDGPKGVRRRHARSTESLVWSSFQLEAKNRSVVLITNFVMFAVNGDRLIVRLSFAVYRLIACLLQAFVAVADKGKDTVEAGLRECRVFLFVHKFPLIVAGQVDLSRNTMAVARSVFANGVLNCIHSRLW